MCLLAGSLRLFYLEKKSNGCEVIVAGVSVAGRAVQVQALTGVLIFSSLLSCDGRDEVMHA
jgi:hypothetical protein